MVMKSKVLLMCMVLCTIATGFVSCESVGIGKRTALINLAELGKQIDYQTKDEAENKSLSLQERDFSEIRSRDYKRCKLLH